MPTYALQPCAELSLCSLPRVSGIQRRALSWDSTPALFPHERSHGVQAVWTKGLTPSFLIQHLPWTLLLQAVVKPEWEFQELLLPWLAI